MQVRLQDQSFEVLTILIERAGQLVTRDDIRSRLWPSNTFVDVNNSLNATINRVRDALGDSADQPVFIETVPRRGYRFIAPVALSPPVLSALPRVGEALAADVPLARPPDAIAAGSNRRRGIAAAIGFASLAVLTGWRLTVTRPAAHHTAPPMDSYVTARYHTDRVTARDTDAAIALLEPVVRAEPQAAAAFAELSRAYRQKAFYFSDDPEPWQQRAFVAAEKALALDPALADAHLARGFLLWSNYKHFAHDGAIEEYRRALALNASLDEAHHQLGNVFAHIGLFDQAAAETARAVALNPGNSMARFHQAVADAHRGQLDQALAGFAATKGFANAALWTNEKAGTLSHMGRSADARSLLAEYAAAHAPDEDGGLIASAYAAELSRDGQAGKAEQFIGEALRAKHQVRIHHHHTAYNLAAAYALLGRTSQALEWMTNAAEDGFPCYPEYASDRSFERVRSDPAVARFLDTVRAEWERYRRQYGEGGSVTR